MPTRYKLTVSDAVAFDVKFSLNEGGDERQFGFRAEAKRAKQPEAGDGTTVGQFLADRAAARMVSWIGDAPLVDEDTGQEVAAGSDALAALYDLLPNMPGLVLSAYLEATNAKAKLGN